MVRIEGPITPPDEVEFDTPYRPWTEQELTEIFKRILGPLDLETLGLPKSNDRVNPITTLEHDLSVKRFTLEGIEYFCRLQYRSPSDLGMWPDGYYVPFPDETVMEVDFPMGGKPVVKRVPLEFDAGRWRGSVNLNYQLNIDGMSTVIGVSRTDDNQNGDVVEHGIVIAGDVKDLLLPSEPKRLSTIELTFLRPNPQT